MKIIAHRALLHGPDKKLENQVSTIRKAIGLDFDVEVDVWVIYNNRDETEWWLGHDGPQIKTDLGFLDSIKESAYFHAKNVDALFQLLKMCKQPGSKFKCFFHDIDEYTITSDGFVWAYPGKKLVPDAICVMPERAPVQDQYRIYAEMKQRQARLVAEGKVTIDADIILSKKDERLCLAIYTFYDNWQPSPAFPRLLQTAQEKFPLQNRYDVSESSDNVLHFTIMQVFGFDDYAQNLPYFEEHRQQYLGIFSSVLKKHMPFTITYRGVMAMQSGLLMVGYPSIDLNDTVRRELYEAMDAASLKYRKYMNNIVHSTVLRLSTADAGLSENLKEIATEFEDTYFGTLTVNKFHVGKSSWRMQAGELKPYCEIKK